MRKVTFLTTIKTVAIMNDDLTMDEIEESIYGLAYSDKDGEDGHPDGMTIEDETIEKLEIEDSR